MSTFPLDQMDEHLLKQIVRKFTATSGAAFYCSCRGAKNLIDHVKPAWNIPGSSINHLGNREVIIGNQRPSFRKGGRSANVPLEFCRIEKVYVYDCDTDYIKTVVVPEVAAIGRVGRLDIVGMSDSGVRLLIAAAKPEAVGLCDEHYDPTSATFESVKNLEIFVNRDNVESYWRAEKLFQLVRNRKSISLKLSKNPKQLIASFIENWQKGEKTGTLERLSFILRAYSSRWTKEDLLMKGFTETEGGHILEREFERRIPPDDLFFENKWSVRKEMEDLMKSHIKTEKGYIVERGGDARLRIRMDFCTFQIDFFFS